MLRAGFRASGHRAWLYGVADAHSYIEPEAGSFGKAYLVDTRGIGAADDPGYSGWRKDSRQVR